MSTDGPSWGSESACCRPSPDNACSGPRARLLVVTALCCPQRTSPATATGKRSPSGLRGRSHLLQPHGAARSSCPVTRDTARWPRAPASELTAEPLRSLRRMVPPVLLGPGASLPTGRWNRRLWRTCSLSGPASSPRASVQGTRPLPGGGRPTRPRTCPGPVSSCGTLGAPVAKSSQPRWLTPIQTWASVRNGGK